MDKMAVLEAENLAIGYGKDASAITIAEGINFTLNQGQFVLIIMTISGLLRKLIHQDV